MQKQCQNCITVRCSDCFSCLRMLERPELVIVQPFILCQPSGSEHPSQVLRGLGKDQQSARQRVSLGGRSSRSTQYMFGICVPIPTVLLRNPLLGLTWQTVRSYGSYDCRGLKSSNDATIWIAEIELSKRSRRPCLTEVHSYAAMEPSAHRHT